MNPFENTPFSAINTHLETWLAALVDPHAVIDAEGVIITANQPFSDLLGLSHLDGKMWDDVQTDPSLGFYRLKTNADVDGDLSTASNSATPVLASLRPMGASAYMLRLKPLSTTITRAQYNALYRATPALLMTLDPAFKVMLVSDSWLNLMEMSKDDARRKSVSSFFEAKDAHTLINVVLPAVFRGQPAHNIALSARTASGKTIQLQVSCVLQKDEKGNPIAAHCVMENVTELKTTQYALEMHAKALEWSSRELNRFTTIASHDLLEPLRKISAFATLLRRRYHGRFDKEADISLDYLVDAAGRMRSLIDDLLIYSRLSTRPLHLSPVDLNTVVKASLDTHDAHMGDTNVSVQCDPLPTVHGDAMLLKHLFENLISNAIKFRKPGGVTIGIHAEQTGDFWKFEVTDNGIGLDTQFTDKVFAPFGRLHHRESYSGNGVGLAICQQAVERHGGHIGVDSIEGVGSTFHFTLPVNINANPTL